MKREGTGAGTDQMLGKVLKRHYVDGAGEGEEGKDGEGKRRLDWWTDPRVPSLARGPWRKHPSDTSDPRRSLALGQGGQPSAFAKPTSVHSDSYRARLAFAPPAALSA